MPDGGHAHQVGCGSAADGAGVGRRAQDAVLVYDNGQELDRGARQCAEDEANDLAR
jgi:hypothetical protein